MLRQTFNQLPTPFWIRDKDTRYVYANMAMAKLVGLKSPDSIIGRLDDEIQAALFQNDVAAKTWQQQVRHVVSTQAKISLLEVHPGSVDYPYITRKFPFYNENNECVGMAVYAKYLEVFTPNDLIKGKLPGSLLLSKPDDFFTEKECEIIFFKIQGMSSKDIANILCLSPRTIENRLANMYIKSGVNHFDDFREFCEKRNLHRYLPQKLLSNKRIGFDGDFSEEIFE
jgi:DNA-binding CsgD family transcriptional regulator